MIVTHQRWREGSPDRKVMTSCLSFPLLPSIFLFARENYYKALPSPSLSSLLSLLSLRSPPSYRISSTAVYRDLESSSITPSSLPRINIQAKAKKQTKNPPKKNVPNIFPRRRLRTCAPGPRLPRREGQSRIHGESQEELRFHVESRRRRREKKQYHPRTACVSFVAEGESCWQERDSGNGGGGPEWEEGVLLDWWGSVRGWSGVGWEGKWRTVLIY